MVPMVQQKEPESGDSVQGRPCTCCLLESGQNPSLWLLISPSVKSSHLGQMVSNGPFSFQE